MAVKTFAVGELVTASDANTYLANAGLVYVKSQTVGTGVSSVTVSSAFSAEYQNYRIIYTGGTSSAAAQALNLKLGAATTNYFSGSVYAIFATGTVGNVVNNGTLGYFLYAGTCDSTMGNFLTLDIFNPFDSTKYTGVGGSFIVTDVAGHTGGIHKSNTSFTEFTLTPGSGTLTGGTIIVYGYRKA